MDASIIKARTKEELMQDNLLVKHRAGSHAYGTNIESSDEDYRGIFCADPINVRTPFFRVNEVEDSSEEDTKIFELAHYMKLCLDCNPNIVETVWVDRSDILLTTPAYEMLREHRSQLLSSKIAFTTVGYALSQLKRIKGHNKWINNPQPEQPPLAKDFLSVIQWFGTDKNLKVNLDTYKNNFRLIPYGGEIYAVVSYKGAQLWDNNGKLNTIYEPADEADRSKLPSPLMIVKWNRDEFKTRLEKHQQYWDWKNNRNEKRSVLEEEFGYDTKHAMHLVRLLRMGVEALRDGEIVVRRPDAQELLSIRNGAWKYEELVEYAEHMNHEVTEVWYKKTALPKKPNIHLAAQLLMDIQDLVWNK
jgi:predicted nucleotidyltransferase